MNTGMRLKYHRKKKRMELEKLAEGILPAEELKKIELGEKTPSLDTLKLLCKKLSIPLYPMENPIGQELISQFKELLLHPQDKMQIREHYSMLIQHPLLNIDEQFEVEYNIQLVRFYVFIGDLDTAEEKIIELDRFKEFMNQEQYYLFHKYQGNYFYMVSDYNHSLKFYLLAEKIYPSDVPPTDLADLYYSIAISATQLHKNELANTYSTKALKIYEKEFIPKRIVECHINLGITQQRLLNLKSAIEHLKVALKIGKKLQIDILRYNVEFNSGFFYFLFQDYDKAIVHLKNSLDYIPSEYVADKLTTYCSLTKCYLEKNDIAEAMRWLSLGEEIIRTNNMDIKSYIHTNQNYAESYIEFLILKNLIEENYNEVEKLVVKHLVPLLRKANNFPELGYYYSKLGNIYFKLGKYKKSAMIYNEAQLAFKSFVNLK